MKIFKNLMGRLSGDRSDKRADLAEILELFPFDGPVYVIGDVHGCMDAFRQMETLILQDSAQFVQAPTIVLLGDIVDRGPQSAALIDHLMLRQRAGNRVICLMGNHEEMMLEFLAKPEANAAWLEFGGLETLASYGIDITEFGRLSGRKIAQILAAYIPHSHFLFLKNTLPGLQVGPYLLTHAGADADQPLTAQPKNALLWGSAGQIAPRDLVLIHGHYVVAEPMLSQMCLSIDTGAYLNGRLSCLRLQPDAKPAILTLSQNSAFTDLNYNVF